MKNEIWKDVVGYEGRYEVSDQGRLRSTEKVRYGPRVLGDSSDNGAGYMINNLWGLDKKQRVKYRHRLVAQAFLPNPNNLPQVGHKDDNKSNNAVSNLYWCEGSTNIQDAHRTGRMKKRKEYGSIKRYDDNIISMAYRAVKRGDMGISQAAKFFGMPRTTLSSFMNKRAKSYVTDPIDMEFEK